MLIESAKLGTVEVEESEIYRFADGLYGFEDHTEFALLIQDETLPFAYLQSVKDLEVCLLLGNPFAFFPDYEFELPGSDKDLLGNPHEEPFAVWTTVSIRQSLDDATANLMAPIVMNTKRKTGKQVVLHNSPFQTRTPLFPARQEAK